MLALKCTFLGKNRLSKALKMPELKHILPYLTQDIYLCLSYGLVLSVFRYLYFICKQLMHFFISTYYTTYLYYASSPPSNYQNWIHATGKLCDILRWVSSTCTFSSLFSILLFKFLVELCFQVFQFVTSTLCEILYQKVMK